MERQKPRLTLLAAIALSTVLGSIHAFSVFVPEWESAFSASRADISLVYSVALVSLTIAVLLGFRVFAVLSPPAVFLISGVGAAIGLAMSASAQSLAGLYFWYGLVFGAANGLGYGYALQLAGQATTTRSGLAMSLVTAFYAVGATSAPPLFVWLINQDSNAQALQTMAVLLGVVAIAASVLLIVGKSSFVSEKRGEAEPLTPLHRRIRKLYWLGYGTAVSAGLMVIGHAYAIAIWQNTNSLLATTATMLVAAGNMLGGFIAGLLLGYGVLRLLATLPLVSVAGLVLILASSDAQSLVLIGLAFAGFSYGALIAIYPVAIAEHFGARASARIYGQVFTAWGLAGLVGPWVSGWLFDITGSYRWSLSFAILLSLVSCLVLVRLRSMNAPNTGGVG